MQVVRTIAWILLTAVVVAFVVANWSEPQDVRLWPTGNEVGGWYVVMWPVGFIALTFTLIGFVPMWLYHRAAKWQLHRRIAALEVAARTAAATPVQTPLVEEPVVAELMPEPAPPSVSTPHPGAPLP